MSAFRKTRRDAILEGLPTEQRQRVNGWLFDKGLGYREVALACWTVLGIKISKSSVARYYERMMREKVERKRRDEQRKTLPAIELKNFGDGHDRLVERLVTVARDYMDGRWDNERWSLRKFVGMVKLVFSLERERLDAERTRLAREVLERKVAKRLLRYYQNLKREERREERNRPDKDGWRRNWSKLYRIENID